MDISKDKIERLLKSSEFKEVNKGKSIIKAGVIVKAKKEVWRYLKKMIL